MTGSPYAYSLAPGAMIAGATTGNSPDPALLNVIATGGSANSTIASEFDNVNGGMGSRTALKATAGGSGSSGNNPIIAGSFYNQGGGSSTGSQSGIQSTLQGAVAGSGYGGIFQDLSSGGHYHYGIFSLAFSGEGIHAISDSSTGQQQSAGVTGVSLASGSDRGAGGVFTGTNGVVGYASGDIATVSGYSDGVSGLSSTTGGSGLFGHAINSTGAGVWGTAYLGPSNSFGGFFDSYDQAASHSAIYARGAGHATGGWFTGLGFGLMVKYDGSGDLHTGDVLALDGNNTTAVDGSPVLGVVKADASNADAAIGVAQYRYSDTPAVDKSNPMSHDTIQVDDSTTTIKSGDLLQIVIAGQTRVKVSGNVKLGDHLTITRDGSVSAAQASDLTIGKVAGKPDANGLVTVVVNFK